MGGVRKPLAYEESYLERAGPYLKDVGGASEGTASKGEKSQQCWNGIFRMEK